MKTIFYILSIILLSNVFFSCTGQIKEKNQVRSDTLDTFPRQASEGTHIQYNRNKLPVSQPLHEIDDLQSLKKESFIGEKFFVDTVNNKLLAAYLSYPISNLYILDFTEKEPYDIFKNYVGYFKDKQFFGLLKIKNQFFKDSFDLNYIQQEQVLILQSQNVKNELFTEISFSQFQSIFKDRISNRVLAEHDNAYKSIFDKKFKPMRALKIPINTLPPNEQKIVTAYDYYYKAILNTDGSLSSVMSADSGRTLRNFDNQIIHEIIPREIKNRRLHVNTIFQQPVTTTIDLRIEFVEK